MRLRSWVESSLVRHFPGTQPRRSRNTPINAALDEQVSFQVAVRMGEGWPLHIRVDAGGPEGWGVRVRRVGHVPVRHHNTPILPDPADTDGLGAIPGYVPDPLFDEHTILLPDGETHAFWITVRPPPDAKPGEHTITVTVKPEGRPPLTHTVCVRLHDIRLGKRSGFRVTHWFYVDALIDWYRTKLFDRRFWSILPKYIRNAVDHGQDTLYVPVFTPPLDGVKRPSQLLRVSRTGKDSYRFDWRDVRRYVRLAKKCGIEHFEWCHFFTQWDVQHAIRIYEGQGRDECLLWPPGTGATSSTYRAFLGQYLPRLHRFLQQEGILDKSFFHVADEPPRDHLERYRAARAMLRDLAPWMRVMDALSDIDFARQGLTDTPIPSIRTALDFVSEAIPCWCYYACGPRGRFLNRLLDTPLTKIAMHGFLFYRWAFRGFLHWGYNYWYQSQTRNLVDPFNTQDGLRWPGWAYGDPFQVYPGPDGPIDSIRWEVFGESLQDYTLLQKLKVSRDDKLLASIRSFEDFPKTATWRDAARAKLFARVR